ncbi:hypothetical protein NOVOSPHI9U_420253 [Novosphingobium sp. 9U]|nr:hypothetical protein NOVOSPHI9U_420253 [Novosphingobium sp. 9U]
MGWSITRDAAVEQLQGFPSFVIPPSPQMTKWVEQRLWKLATWRNRSRVKLGDDDALTARSRST